MEDDGDSYGGGGRKNKSKKPAKPEQIIRLTESDDKYPSDVPAGTKAINFDWCDKMSAIIREVIRQGDRRICWTIASSRSLSARLLLEKRFDAPLRLSALHLLVGLIDHVDSTGGLNNLGHLRTFLIEQGTVLETDCNCPQLALEMKNNTSKSKPVVCTEKAKAKHTPRFKVEELIIIEENEVDERQLIGLVKDGPVAVCIDVYDNFMLFKGDGIYLGHPRDKTRLDQHLLLVTGYATKMPEGIHYWKVQNSLGTNWGDKGYGKIVRQISRAEGERSLFTKVLYPRLLDHYEGERARE